MKIYVGKFNENVDVEMGFFNEKTAAELTASYKEVDLDLSDFKKNNLKDFKKEYSDWMEHEFKHKREELDEDKKIVQTWSNPEERKAHEDKYPSLSKWGVDDIELNSEHLEYVYIDHSNHDDTVVKKHIEIKDEMSIDELVDVRHFVDDNF
jgi:hypothetical protein